MAHGVSELGNQTSLSAYLDLKPVNRITIEPSLDYVVNKHSETDQQLYEEMIGRVRLQLQTTKKLSLRLVVQYDKYEYLSNDNSLQEGRAWDVDPLITYRISPFSVLYAGTTHDWSYFNRDPNATAQTPAQWEPGYKLTNRQYYMKLQYMLQI